MGFRFFRRLRILPGITVNLSKSGASVSVGVRGSHVTFGQKGIRETIGIPNSGLSYTKRTGWIRKGKRYLTNPSLACGSGEMLVPPPSAVSSPNVGSDTRNEKYDSESWSLLSDQPENIIQRGDTWTACVFDQFGRARQNFIIGYSPWAQIPAPASEHRYRSRLPPSMVEEAQSLRSSENALDFIQRLAKRARQGLPRCQKCAFEIDWFETGCLKCNPQPKSPRWHWIPIGNGGRWVLGARRGVLWKLRNGEFRKLEYDTIGKPDEPSKRWRTYYEDFCERMLFERGENYPREAEDVDRIRFHFVEESILSFMELAETTEEG